MSSLFALGDKRPQSYSIFIAPSAQIIGDVILAAETSVWFGAVIRGDADKIRIGFGTNIQDNAVLHCDPGFSLDIGEFCTIGHAAIVHGCTLGAGVLVGMGATIMNGAVVGQGSIVGAGALITEGQIIPPFSVVLGQPGKVKKTMDRSTMDDRKEQAQRYIERAHQYASDLTAQE